MIRESGEIRPLKHKNRTQRIAQPSGDRVRNGWNFKYSLSPNSGRAGIGCCSGSTPNIWQQLLKTLHVLPVNLILADALPRSEVIMRLGIGAEFAAIEATGAALPGSLGIDHAMAIAALHVDSSAALTPKRGSRFPRREGQRLVPDQSKAARLLSARKMGRQMQNAVNRRWPLANYPKGMPSTETDPRTPSRCLIPDRARSWSKRNGFPSTAHARTHESKEDVRSGIER